MIGEVVYRPVSLDLFSFSLAAYLTADHFPNLVLTVLCYEGKFRFYAYQRVSTVCNNDCRGQS